MPLHEFRTLFLICQPNRVDVLVVERAKTRITGEFAHRASRASGVFTAIGTNYGYAVSGI